MTKREKACSKCHRPITGHPLPIDVNCELTIEKVCSKCKNPIKGHPKPTGSNCEFGRGIRSKSKMYHIQKIRQKKRIVSNLQKNRISTLEGEKC